MQKKLDLDSAVFELNGIASAFDLILQAFSEDQANFGELEALFRKRVGAVYLPALDLIKISIDRLLEGMEEMQL